MADRRRLRLLATMLVAVVAAVPGGCSAVPTVTPTDGRIAVPTDPGMIPGGGAGILCTGSVVASLQGTLAGDPAASPPVWLVDESGRRIDVVWPAGFSVRFTADGPDLLDEQGLLVATSKIELVLGQVGAGSAPPGEPVRARGQIGGRCYLPRA